MNCSVNWMIGFVIFNNVSTRTYTVEMLDLLNRWFVFGCMNLIK